MRRALTVDLMKMGRHLHEAGSADLPWYEVRALVSGQWPEMHVSRHRVEGVALLDPAVRVALLTADAVRAANWQRARGTPHDYPASAATVIYPSLNITDADDDDSDATPAQRPRQRTVTTADDVARIRERLAHLRATAAPSKPPEEEEPT